MDGNNILKNPGGTASRQRILNKSAQLHRIQEQYDMNICTQVALPHNKLKETTHFLYSPDKKMEKKKMKKELVHKPMNADNTGIVH